MFYLHELNIKILKSQLNIGHLVFQLVHKEVEEGIAMCKATCEYWNYCGGGEPSSKFFQFGRFDVAETTTCKIHKQSTVDVILDYLERKSASNLLTSFTNLAQLDVIDRIL